MNTHSDDFLLLRWHDQRDAHAFHEIARRHAPMVYATCKRILRNAAEAEDLTQECFLFLAQQTQCPPECVPAWLHVVAVRRSLSRLRALGRRATRERLFAVEQTRTLEPGPAQVYSEVDEALAELPELLRVPLVLHFLEQRGQDEIAAQLGVAQSTISRRLDKGIAELRSRLERRHVFVSAGVLAASLQAEAEAVVPASLSAALGKISLAGNTAGAAITSGISAAEVAAFGGALLMKKLLIAATGIAFAALAVYWAMPKEVEQRPNASETTTEAATPDDAASDASTVTNANAVAPAAPANPTPIEPVAADIEEGGNTIQGHVLDAVTGEGLPGVVITAKWGNEDDAAGEFGEVESAPTDAEGGYRITGLAGPAAVRYEVSRDTPDGYRRPTYSERLGVVIGDSGAVSGVDFLLRKAAPLSGVVVDQENRPVQGANVVMGGGMDIFVSEKATTDATGNFSFATLPPTTDLSIAATKGDALASEPYEFTLPEEGITDLVLVLDAACQVSGIVVDATGKPLADHQVVSLRVPSTRVGAAQTQGKTGADGRFELVGLPSGAYQLVAFGKEMKGTGSVQKGVPIDLEPGQHLSDMTLVFGRDLTIAGRVTDGQGEPVENVSVRAGSAEHGGSDAKTDSTGHFTIEGLEEGGYQIDIEPTEKFQFVQIAEVLAGTTDLQIVLPEPFVVTGQVLDAQTGQPIPEFEIVLGLNWEDGLDSWMSKQFQKVSNPEGRFELLQKQLYRSMLAARAPGYATATRILDLTGPPYAHEADLKLVRGQDLAGKVVDIQGAPVEGAAIYWGKITAIGDRAATQSAADGSFTLASFPSEPQLISVHHPSFAPAAMLIEGTARLQPVEIVLTEGGTIEGTVAFAEGTEAKACNASVVYNEGHYIPEMSVDVSPDGTFRFERIQPGEVKVRLGVGTDLPFPEQDVFWQTAAVEPGGVSTMEFDVRSSAGVLDGTLQYPEGALPSRVMLTLECATDTGTASRMTLVATSGAFRFEGLPPGPGELKIDASFQNHRRIATSVIVEVTEGDAAPIEVPL